MKRLDVLYTTDKNYLDIMMASILSLVQNGKIENLHCHIITTGLDKEDYYKIESFFPSYSITFHFYDLNTIDFEKYNVPKWRGTHISNARLFLEEILHPNLHEIKNLLYLDSDTIVISELQKLEQYKEHLGLVKDFGVLKNGHPNINVNNYYNSGVIWINMDKWIRNEYQKRMIEFSKENRFLIYPDQDILNGALSNEIKSLPIEFNMPPYFYVFESVFQDAFLNLHNLKKEELVRAKKEAIIWHSYGLAGIKPWTNNRINPYNDEFLKYLLEINPEFSKLNLSTFKQIIASSPLFFQVLISMGFYAPEAIVSKWQNRSKILK